MGVLLPQGCQKGDGNQRSDLTAGLFAEEAVMAFPRFLLRRPTIFCKVIFNCECPQWDAHVTMSQCFATIGY